MKRLEHLIGKGHQLSALLVGAIALIVYRLTLAPTITWGHYGADGGDLMAAAYNLGVPHPPGYPLYVLLGYAFGRLEWLGGDVAFRFNLFSAICAAGAAGLLTLLIARRTHLLPGWIGGLTFAFGPMIWSQATITEVYALNVLVVSILFLLVFSERPRWSLIGLVWGVTWITHLSSLLLFPLLVWLWWREKDTGRKKVGCLLFGWLLGFIPLLILPAVLAVRDPVINWGDPVSIQNWWWLVSGKLYRVYAFALPLVEWPNRILSLVRFGVQQVTFPGLFVVVWGGTQLFERDRAQCFALISAAGVMAVYALGYNTADSQVFLIPAWLIIAILLGTGVDEFTRTLPKHKIIAWAGLVIPLYLLISGWAEADLSHDVEAADFGKNVLAEAPADAVIYTAADMHTFSLWYYQYVEGLRPDIAIVDRGLLVHGWYVAMLEKQNWQYPVDAAGRPRCELGVNGGLTCGN